MKEEPSTARLVLMHLARAHDKKICISGRGERGGMIEAVVRIAANALFDEDRGNGRIVRIDRVIRWVHKKGLDISDTDVERIAIEEARNEFLYSIEDRGRMLRITSDERVKHEVWMLGAHGETASDRRAAREARAANKREERLAKSKAMTAAKRGPMHVNVSAAARHFDVSRPTIFKWKSQWEEAVMTGGNTKDFYSFCQGKITNSPFNYKGTPLSMIEIAIVLDRHISTIYTWDKTPGKVQSKLNSARPKGAGAALIREKRKTLHSVEFTPDVDQPSYAAHGLEARAARLPAGPKVASSL